MKKATNVSVYSINEFYTSNREQGKSI